MATKTRDVSYIEDEIRSYLPTGWNLAEPGVAGEWKDEHDAWASRVIDEVDFDYQVVVRPGDVEEHGRMGALKRAVDYVQRQRLGKPTRGLGRLF